MIRAMRGSLHARARMWTQLRGVGVVFDSEKVTIANCKPEWEFQCSKDWSGLTATAKSNERFCGSCKHIVYFCTTSEELQRRIADRQCVAFDVEGIKGDGEEIETSQTQTRSPRRLLGRIIRF